MRNLGGISFEGWVKKRKRVPLYPAKVTCESFRRCARTMLPRVWSSLLKVNTELFGVPVGKSVDAF